MPDYKHYIKINENNEIIELFSNAFQTPDETSILFAESDSRHVMINDIINPNIINSADMSYLYKWNKKKKGNRDNIIKL